MPNPHTHLYAAADSTHNEADTKKAYSTYDKDNLHQGFIFINEPLIAGVVQATVKTRTT